MTKKLVVSASLLAKSQVASYTRSDGTMVQSHDNGRQAAAPKKLGVGSTVKVTGKTTKEGGIGQIKQSQGEHHIVKFQDGSSYLYHHSDLSAHADAEQSSAKPEPVNQKALAKLKASHHMDARALKSSLGSSLSSGDTEGHDGKPMTYGDVKGHLNTMRMQLGSKPEHAEHLKHAQYALNQSFGLNHAPVSEKHAKLIGAALSGKTRMDDNGVVQHAGGDKPAPKLAVRASGGGAEASGSGGANAK